MLPRYGVVYWGDTVVLICDKMPTAEWLLNDTPLKSELNQTLILPAVSGDNSGDYYCQASEKSDKFNINVLSRFSLMSTFIHTLKELSGVNKHVG